MGDRYQETDEGYYVQNGDVLEWKWAEPKADKPADKKQPTKAGRATTGKDG